MASRRLRYAPSGPFAGDDGDGSANIYSVETEGTITTVDDDPLTVQTWTVPVGAAGTFLIEWYAELSSNADTSEGLNIGSISLVADAVAASSVSIAAVGDDDPVPWYQASGFAVRELAAGDVVNLQILCEIEANLSARRRRLAIFPVTLLT